MGALGEDSGPPAPLLSYPAPSAGSAVFDTAIPAGWAFNRGAFTEAELPVPVVEDGALAFKFSSTASKDPGASGTKPGMGAARVETANIPAGDFTLYSAWFSNPMLENAGYAGGGFIFETADNFSARLEVYNMASQNNLRSFCRTGGSTISNAIIDNLGWMPFHKLERVGSTWTFSGGRDGKTYTQICTFDWAADVVKIAPYCYQMNPNGVGTEFRLAYASFDEPYLPTVRGKVIRSPIRTEVWNDLSLWDNGSMGTGGSAAVSGGKLILNCGTADRSVGRVATKEILPANAGLHTTAIRLSAAAGAVFFGAGMRGGSYSGQAWAGQYAPPLALVHEANLSNDLIRMVGTSGFLDAAVDGAKWTYFDEVSPGEADIVNETNIRLETVGPVFRTKVWDVGNPEPDIWHSEVYVGLQEAGKIALALSHNDGQAVSGSVQFGPMELYEIL